MSNKLSIINRSFENKFSRNRVLMIYVSGPIMLCVMLLFQYFNHQGSIYFLLIFLIGLVLYLLIIWTQKFFNLKKIKQKTIGSIMWKDDDLIHIINKEEVYRIEITAIQSMEFKYESYYGEGEAYKWIEPKHQNYHFGTNNKIRINLKEKVHDFYIFLKDKNERMVFFELLHLAYDNSIKVKEFYKKKRSYGGNFLKYSEIQEYKKRY